ncbi:TPA: hypothetical protein DEP31_03090 [Candidatus Azambacteria bacterium]|nr:hypothetical protein [Candidatus Azambacteria bacterium]
MKEQVTPGSNPDAPTNSDFFLLKGFDNRFALMFGLMPNGGNASHPTAPTAQNRRAKIPSPQLPSFSPA